jgi:hypothetical protein
MTSGTNDAEPDPLRALSEDVRTLVRQELRHAQDELAGSAQRAAKAAGLFGGAAVLAALATGTSAMLLTRVLERFLAPATAAFVACALFGGGAGALAGAGVAEFRRARPLLPRETVERLRRDTRAAAQASEATPDGP